MANFLHSNINESDLIGLLAASPMRSSLPSASAEAWQIARRNPLIRQWIIPLREQAGVEAGAEMPVLTDSLYREFYATGARVNFETVYFERRRQLARAVVCALLDEDNAHWLESMRHKTSGILAEFSWALPANVNSPYGRDPRCIDPHAAETANLMAELVDLFGQSLGNELIDKIKRRLRGEFFENYVERHEEFSWLLGADSRNAICHQGILGAALVLEWDFVLVAGMLTLAKKYLQMYLSAFGNDGGCSEGPGYWQQGFGAFCMLNEQLETRTNGELSLIEGDEKFTEIARFGPRMMLHHFQMVNFSDSPQAGRIKPSLLEYLGKRLDDDFFRTRTLQSYRQLHEAGLPLQVQRGELSDLARLLLSCPDHLPEKGVVEYEDVFFQDLGVVVTHAEDEKHNFWDVAAKAGNNAEQHNHNDCGSYIVNINGEPMIVEIGAPEYTRDYFRKRRYEYLAARTLGHSLPIVNGCEQSAGPIYSSKVLISEITGDHLHFCVDLTHCYPADAGCNELIRDLYWNKTTGNLQVKDLYDLERYESFESAIITDKPVVLSDGVAVIYGNGCSLVVRPMPKTVFAGVEEHEYHNHSGARTKVNRIILIPDDLKAQKFIGYEIGLSDG